MGNKEQIYGRNDMVMLEKHNKIYGSLGIVEPYVFDTKTGETIIMENPKKGKFEDVVTEFNVYGKSTQQTTTGAQLFDVNAGGAGWLNQETGAFIVNNDSYVSEYIPVKRGAQYYINYDISQYVYSYDSSKQFLRKETYKNSFAVGDDVFYIRFAISNNKEVALKKAKTIMLNEGSSAKPYEPYTGGKPSPSIEYPQEIMSAGDKGSINVDVDNNGYIQKGTYFDNIRSLPLARGYTYHIEGNTRDNNINCFVLNESDKIFYTSAILYNYGYDNKKLTIVNETGVVDKECRMPMNYENGYTFKVTVDGLYLYQGVNQSILDTDDFYIGHHADIVDEEYKKQTLTLKTPNGLLGIPVSAGGNYTDSTGQQWVCDEIDFGRGKYIQRVNKAHIIPQDVEFLNIVNTYEKCDVLVCKLIYKYPSIINNSFYTPIKADKYRQYTGNWNDGVGMIASNYGNIYISVEKGVTTIEETDIAYVLQTPIERDLTPEEIQAYKALHTNYPTTVIMNDENAGMKVTYKQLESKTRAVN